LPAIVDVNQIGGKASYKMRFYQAAIFLGGFAGMASPALAHHPLGGGTPETVAHGVLSGIGHPMLGIDHLAFIVAMALAAVAMGRLATAPLAFLAGSMIGVLATYNGIAVPMIELMVAGSATLIGAIVLSGRKLTMPVAVGLFAAAGLFHGAAYGGAIVGAESTPLLAYLGGLLVTQYAIALGVGMLARLLWNGANAASVSLRASGGVAAGVGFAFLFERVEGLTFPGIV
jgi:urease accessory protein